MGQTGLSLGKSLSDTDGHGFEWQIWMSLSGKTDLTEGFDCDCAVHWSVIDWERWVCFLQDIWVCLSLRQICL